MTQSGALRFECVGNFKKGENGVKERGGRLTIFKLLGVTALIAAGLAFVPKIYNRMNDGLGNGIAVVLLITILLGAGIGLLIGGVESAFRGVLIGLILFLIAMVVLYVAVFPLVLEAR